MYVPGQKSSSKICATSVFFKPLPKVEKNPPPNENSANLVTMFFSSVSDAIKIKKNFAKSNTVEWYYFATHVSQAR
jgi:hypothetical protein